MQTFALAVVLGVAVSSPTFAQQKTSQPKANGKTCTYDQCVSANKARGWDSAAVSRWCSANPGKCDN
ncbi:hypothetical protein [Bradyrhizobium sp. RDT46]|uniref:hypothetical protein n=1 Tax=Bradyrhizobium sp. RDT46 TaxID=3341829 RepID=UPI0035C772F0